MEEKKNNRGGRRPGSGRKKLDSPLVTVSGMVSMEDRQKLIDIAHARDVSPSAIVREAVEAYLKGL